MGLFYGDIHYGIKISKKVKNDDLIFLETIFELTFVDRTISFNDYLDSINNEFLNLIDPEKYQFALYVDIISTHNQIKMCKGWQNITTEQMVNFLNNSYKIDYL
jgi:hypothetical protein